MAVTAASSPGVLDLIDRTTIISLFSTLAILFAALALSKIVLAPNTASRMRFLFVWHAFDFLIHFILEGSFVYHCLFSSTDVRHVSGDYWPNPVGYLGRAAASKKIVNGAQAGGANPLAQLWMVYSKADRRWAGVDLGVLSIEIITVLFAGLMAVWVCVDIARKKERVYVSMIVLATAEIYGGYMTFMPEWLSGSANLDTSNFMYKWIFLAFFNGLWVVIPIYAIYVGSMEILDAFKVRTKVRAKLLEKERVQEKEYREKPEVKKRSSRSS
ncbi:putative Emopamil-binding protein-like protein [Podospora australis]|uniref:Emopamil-binding protein-like protein n=1 Tax=Podospora australis TaxID=1536484 RepID=A0AAN6WV58_9PEZI|nr:putative Emopamil-binding protein-like protein [Podospora australis]